MAGINSYVLDSYALIGFLENEKFASRVERLLKQARKGKTLVYLHALHLVIRTSETPKLSAMSHELKLFSLF